MAAPTLDASGLGLVITGTTAVSVGIPAGAGGIGDWCMLQVLQDGTGADATLGVTDTGKIENLAGTDDTLTFIGTFQVGSPAAAKLHLWIGRTITTISAAANITSSSGDDCYCRGYRGSNMNTGTTLSDVLENASAGSTPSTAATSTNVADVGVTTLGADRLAMNWIGINDDGTGIDQFTGESGGTWSAMQVFESSTGTDGTVAMCTAAMASAGTINGGSDTITSDGWGVVGFALIGTTAASAVLDQELVTLQAVNRASAY